jgi:hypothetical protein
MIMPYAYDIPTIKEVKPFTYYDGKVKDTTFIYPSAKIDKSVILCYSSDMKSCRITSKGPINIEPISMAEGD